MATKHLAPEVLNQRRREAVRWRLDGHTVAEASRRSGLSAPTVSAAWKAFREGGWNAIDVKPRGRRSGDAQVLGTDQQTRLDALLHAWPESGEPGMTPRALARALSGAPAASEQAPEPSAGRVPSVRAIEHWLTEQRLKPQPWRLEGLGQAPGQVGRWYRQQCRPVVKACTRAGGSVWRGGVSAVPLGGYRLYLHGKRDTLYLKLLEKPPRADDYLTLFERLLTTVSSPMAAPASAVPPITLVFHGAWFQKSPEISAWLSQHPAMTLMGIPACSSSKRT